MQLYKNLCEGPFHYGSQHENAVASPQTGAGAEFSRGEG